MTENPHRIGLIGFGAFGRFLARHLAPYAGIAAYDPGGIVADADAPVTPVSLAEASAQPLVIFAVPVQHLRACLAEAAPHMQPGALAVDVSSVKMKPVEWMQELLPQSVEILATHPLFGPQSGRHGIAGMTVVLCPVRCERMDAVKTFLAEMLGLKAVVSTPEGHDREIAFVQGLTHFLSRGVRQMGLHPSQFATPAYEHMLAIGEILRDDSDALFRTIQTFNPYAAEERARFLETLTQIDESLEDIDA